MKPGIIYNITTKVAAPVQAQWLQWLQEEEIPRMIASGCFYDALVCIVEQAGPDTTYAVQYYAKNREDLERFTSRYQQAFREHALARWGMEAPDFRTVLEVVN